MMVSSTSSGASKVIGPSILGGEAANVMDPWLDGEPSPYWELLLDWEAPMKKVGNVGGVTARHAPKTMRWGKEDILTH